MNQERTSRTLAALLGALAVGATFGLGRALAQEQSQEQEQYQQPTQGMRTGDVDAQIEALRADLRADKTEIVGKAMNLSQDKAKKFWPVYQDYERDLKKLNDEKAQLIKEYAQTYGRIDNTTARAMAEKQFDLDFRRAELQRRYFPRFSREVSAVTAARFFQLENRLNALVDVKLASELPPVLEMPPAPPAPGAPKPEEKSGQ